MVHWKYLEHTADVRLKVEADTLVGLFGGALEGMSNLMREGSCKAEGGYGITEEIRITSVDLTTLLIDFLSQALTLSFERKAVFCKLHVTTLREHELVGRLLGKETDGFEEDIKAVTYHEADVHRNKAGNWTTVIVFDI